EISVSPASQSDSKLEWKARKELQAAARKRENEIAKLEAEIEKLENRSSEIDSLMATDEYCNNSAKLMQLQTEKDDISSKLETAYEKWEEISS
ncbi:MAG: ABC transporter ATP-binding protein, partial [Lachnospiraceae bacterium]|nr:ABC transporter ATP-binding protein [Lachnospiraceae bacterium]